MKPYYETELGKLYNGDCLDVMLSIDGGDLSFFDPPYNVGKDYGEYKDNLPDKKYRQWVCKFLSFAMNKTNHLCVYTPNKHGLYYWSLLGEKFQQIIIPYSPAGAIRNGFSNQFSFLLTNAKPVRKNCRNVWDGCQLPGLGWFFNENTFGHPGYTSESITMRVVDNFTIENETVLDIFHGSGTTGVVCERLNRKWIGIEISEKYCEIAAQRIENERKQRKLF